VNRIAGIITTAQKTANAIRRIDGVMNIGRGLIVLIIS
jgi:hypothetical protein